MSTRASSTGPQMDINAVYEENGRMYRYFLTWRQLVWAANLLVAGAVLKELDSIEWYVPLFVSPLGVILWLADRRNDRLTRNALRAAAETETNHGCTGYYQTQTADDEKLYPWTHNEAAEKTPFAWMRAERRAKHRIAPILRNSLNTHSVAALLFLLGSSAMFIALGILRWLQPSPETQITP